MLSMNKNGLRFSLSFGLILTVISAWGQVSSPSNISSSSSPLYPYLTPFAQYEDLQIPLGYFLQYEAYKLKNLGQLNAEQRMVLIQDALEQMIYEHRMAQQAFERQIDQDPDYLAFNRDMENERLTSLFEFINFQIPFQVTREEIEKKYESMKETEFKLLPEFTFHQIFTQTIDKSEEEKRKARERIEAAQAAIQAGSDFIEVARMYSEAQNIDALLGPFTPRAYPGEKKINPVLEEALLKLQGREISPIVESRYGFHLLRLETLTPLVYVSLPEVFKTVVARLRSEKLEAWRKDRQENHWQEAVILYQPEKMFESDCPPDTVLATVYGESITLDRFRKRMGFGFVKSKNQNDQEYREQLLRHFNRMAIYQEIIAKQAREQRYTEIPQWIYSTRERRIRKVYNLWWKKLSEQYKRDYPVRFEDIKEYYDKHPNQALEPFQVHAAEMTFKKSAPDPQDRYSKFRAVQLARERAQEALRRVFGGEPFEEVAMEMSDSESAGRGGDVGMVRNNDPQLPYPVVDRVLQLESGVVYDQVIVTDDAFYLVKCLERPERVTLDLNDPRTQKRLENLIANQRIMEYKKRCFQEMVNPGKITILFDRMAEIDPLQVDAVSTQVP